MINLINNSNLNKIDRKQIKISENKYKKIESSYNEYDFDNDLDFSWNKLFLEECKKQFNIHKGLQPGKTIELCAVTLLSELLLGSDYNYSSDINNFEGDLSKDDLFKAKHICYKNNTYIISKGDPQSEDIRVIKDNKIIRIEIKDFNANCFDSDLYYDENGKLLLPENKNNELINNVINQFNNETSIIDHCGKNYKFMPSKDFIDYIIRDYNKRNIDFIMILTKYKNDYKFTAIKINDLKENNMISTKGSEIRTNGKNYSNVFTPQLLNKTLNDLDIINDSGNCKVYKNNNKTMGFIKGRHKDSYTRYKINHQFIVKTDNLTEFNDHYEFSINKIKQIKPSIQLHISIKP